MNTVSGAMFSGGALGHAVIAMAGAEDRSLCSLLSRFFEEDRHSFYVSDAADPALAELRAMAHTALMEAQILLEEARGHPHDDREIAHCQKLVREAEGCVAQANQARRGQPIGALKANIRAISAAVHTEAVVMGGIAAPVEWRKAERKEALASYETAHPDAPREATEVVQLTRELSTILHAPASPSRVERVLCRLSRASRTLVDSGKQAVEAVKSSARYLADGTVRISRRAVRCWRDLRAAAVASYHSLIDLFSDTVPEEEAAAVLAPSPLPTLSIGNARMLEGVISTLRPFAISDVIEISPHHRITASEIAGIVGGSSEFILLRPWR